MSETTINSSTTPAQEAPPVTRTVIEVPVNRPQPLDLVTSSYQALQSGAFAVIVAGGLVFWFMKGKVSAYFDSLVSTNQELTKLAQLTSEAMRDEKIQNTAILDTVKIGNQQHVAINRKLLAIETLCIDLKRLVEDVVHDKTP